MVKEKHPKKSLTNLESELSVLKLTQEALMDSLNDGVVVLDNELKIVDVNKAFVNIFRIQEAELLGLQDQVFYKKLSSLLDEMSVEGFQKVTEQVKDSSKLIGDLFEIKIIKPREVFLKAFTAPIYEEKEGFIGRIWKFENINEEKKIDNMKTEFISIASHQLRTPLSAIVGNLDMIMNGDFGNVDERVKDSLQDMKEAASNLIDLVNGLLDVSRLEMGNIEPDIVEVDVIQVVNQIIEEFQPMFKVKALNLLHDKPKTLVIQTDIKLFTEALRNYLSNAIKYTPQGGNIMLTIREVDKKVYAEVTDTGIGIPQDQMDGLFEKFFRADNVLTENFEGTGLGLYYVKKAIEALGGMVGYKPGDMNGSTFWFEVPKNPEI